MSHSNAYEQRPTTWPMGPFEREPIGDAGHAAGVWPVTGTPLKPWNRARMLEALAGVELGAYDQRILEWLTDWEPSTLAVIAGWIKRARRDAGAVCPGCDQRGLDIRQQTNGDLVCHRCGRMVAPTPATPVSPSQAFGEFHVGPDLDVDVLLWRVKCEEPDCDWSTDLGDMNAASAAVGRHIRKCHRAGGADVRIEILRPVGEAEDVT